MRSLIAALPLLALAACGGSSAPESAGSVAPPSSGTPAAPTDVFSQFTAPVESKTYKGIGGSQVFEYITDGRNCCGQQAQIYAGNASTVRDSGITIAYDPRDAIFTLTLIDPLSKAATNTRFQDPANRTNFGGTVEPQWGTPDFNSASTVPAQYRNSNIQFLQAGDGNPISPYAYSGTGLIYPGNNSTPPDGEPGSSYQSTTLFYEKPGSATKYVTFAGYLRNTVNFASATIEGNLVPTNRWHLERGAFAYGAQTLNSNVPTTGTGSFSGSMLATMVYNPTFDGDFGAELPTYFQWLTGTSQLSIDFGTKQVTLAMAGVVLAPQIDRYTAPTRSILPAGTTFSARGTATIDLANKGGFVGSFTGGNFTFVNGGATTAVSVTGSSIDGAFFGPQAQEVGGGFRVVGGIPDQRVDILGAFTAKK